jgi:U3 small nucleolar RNA-associated protein 13
MIRIWEHKKIKKTFKLNKAYALDISFDKTGTLLAAGLTNGSVQVFDVVKGFCTHFFLKGHPRGLILKIEFHPNPETLVLFTSSDDQTIRAWDLNMKACAGVFKGHQGTIPYFTFTNDGWTLISCGRDKTVSFWNLKGKYERIGSHESEDDSECAIYLFKNDIPYLITGTEGGKLRILDINKQEYVFTEDTKLKQSITKLIHLKKSNEILAITNDHNFLYYTLQIENSSVKLVKERGYSAYNEEIIDVRFLNEKKAIMCSNSEVFK